MRLLMVAPPGAGKGTQASRLSSHYGIAHLSSGDLFRKEVAAGTEIGRRAEEYVGRGDLVPDELVLEMLQAPLLEAAARGGYVLDGFPRTLRQAEEAHEVARQVSGIELQAVIHLEVSPAELRRRLIARAQAEGRVDDTAATIDHRIQVYDSETKPMLDFYARRSLVVDIDGEQPIEKVYADVVAAVDKVRDGLG
jgi:adenylate kinase